MLRKLIGEEFQIFSEQKKSNQVHESRLQGYRSVTSKGFRTGCNYIDIDVHKM